LKLEKNTNPTKEPYMKKKLAKRTLKPAPKTVKVVANKKPALVSGVKGRAKKNNPAAATPDEKRDAKNKKPSALRRKKHEAPPSQRAIEPVDADAPRIESRLIIGELSLPVDVSDLCHTLGCAGSGYGRGLVDAWPDTAWAGILTHLGLPAFPLDRAVAAGPVKRLVQRLWYQAVGTSSGVSQERAAELSARRPADTASEERYKQEFPNVVQAMSEKVERGRAMATTLRAARPAAAEQTITVVSKENPYKPGSKAAATFELFRKAKTTSKFLELAAADKSKYEVGYLRYSSRDGYIKLT
jgi:hypothetical protein